MTHDQSQRVVIQTTQTRRQAEAILQRLERAKAETERRLSEARRSDAMRMVTGRSALDNAISDTRRMIDQLDRTMARVGGRLNGSLMSQLDGAPSGGEVDAHDDFTGADAIHIRPVLNTVGAADSLPSA